MSDSGVDGTGATIRVLHVDDEPGFAALAVEFLTREDDRFEIETEASAADGLDRLEHGEFDCVVSDYDMPEVDGLEFLDAAREQFPNMPFILFTGKGSEEIASEAISAGVTDYLQKGRGREQYTILANRIRNAVSQYRAEKEAAHHRRVSTLVRDVMRLLVGAASREEVEQAVCDRLTASEQYLFAWIGEADRVTGEIRPRATAGADDGYLDDITVTVGTDATANGPAGSALRERQVCAAQNVDEDPSFEPWRDQALERGFQSVAGVPLSHDDQIYGVLVVYSTTANAFDAQERALLAELGGTVGHVIDTIQIRNRLDQQYSDLFETAPVMYALTREEDGEPVIVDCNQRFLDRLGYDRAEVVGTPLVNIYTADSTAELLDDGGYSRALDGEFTQEKRQLLTADGDVVDTVLRAAPRYDQDGETVGTLALFVDSQTRASGEMTVAGSDIVDVSTQPRRSSHDEA